MIAIPGYAEAIAREQRRRDRAWLGIGTVLFDARGKPAVTLRPLTYRQYLALLLSDNGIVTGAPEPHDLFAAIWLLSDKHVPGWGIRARIARWMLYRCAGKLPAHDTIAAVTQHISDGFADAPAALGESSSPARPPRSSHFASTFAALRREFGLGVTEALDMPLGQLWQLMRELHLRHDRNAIFRDESEMIKAAWLAERTNALRQRKADATAEPVEAT
jgi:hypothetical protein